MTELTPIEKTVVGQELIQIGKTLGREEGKKEGMQKGRLIGEICLAQRILSHPRIPEKNLSRMSLKRLRDILSEMESELYRD